MKLFLALAFVAFASPLYAQINATVRLGQPVNYAWDYTVANATNSAATRFEIQIGTNPRINPGLAPGALTYVFALPLAQLPLGKHTVVVFACNAVECGPASAQAVLTVNPLMP